MSEFLWYNKYKNEEVSSEMIDCIAKKALSVIVALLLCLSALPIRESKSILSS